MTPKSRDLTTRRFAAFCFVCLVMATPIHSRRADSSAQQPASQKYFTDVELVNQDNQTMRLYSDLIKGKTVIVNSFFTTDEGSSLSMNRNLKQIQERLGESVGRQVVIFSISVDPTVDTPAQLKEYAKKLGAGPGWYFLTGDKQNVEAALRKLGLYVENKQDHLNIVIIGNEGTGLWKKAFGLANIEELTKIVESVVNDKRT